VPGPSSAETSIAGRSSRSSRKKKSKKDKKKNRKQHKKKKRSCSVEREVCGSGLDDPVGSAASSEKERRRKQKKDKHERREEKKRLKAMIGEERGSPFPWLKAPSCDGFTLDKIFGDVDFDCDAEERCSESPSSFSPSESLRASGVSVKRLKRNSEEGSRKRRETLSESSSDAHPFTVRFMRRENDENSFCSERAESRRGRDFCEENRRQGQPRDKILFNFFPRQGSPH
jgi:hypothetical protein